MTNETLSPNMLILQKKKNLLFLILWNNLNAEGNLKW